MKNEILLFSGINVCGWMLCNITDFPKYKNFQNQYSGRPHNHSQTSAEQLAISISCCAHSQMRSNKWSPSLLYIVYLGPCFVFVLCAIWCFFVANLHQNLSDYVQSFTIFPSPNISQTKPRQTSSVRPQPDALRLPASSLSKSSY